MPTFADWEALQVAVGTVTRVEPHPRARQPSYRLWIDFGQLGTKQSSAKITDLYTPEELMGRQLVAVAGFPPLRVGGFRSDVLVLGALTEQGVVLVAPDRPVRPGSFVA